MIYAVQLTSVPSNDTVDLCTNITFTCEGYGAPAPNITWKHSDVPLSMAIVNRSESLNGTTYISSNLSINNLQYQKGGLYMCCIQNELGNDTATFNLSINYEGI